MEPIQGDSIECFICQRRSFKLQDIIDLYCGSCHEFLRPEQYKIHRAPRIYADVQIRSGDKAGRRRLGEAIISRI
jgi:hypothetical protein